MKRYIATFALGLPIASSIASIACGPSKPPTAAGAPSDSASAASATPPSDSAADAGSSTPASSGTSAAFTGQAATSTSSDVTRGVAALKGGNYNDARSAFETALKKNPKQADAYYYMGVLMDRTGDKAAAEKDYKQAFELSPDLLDAAINLMAIYIEGKKFDNAIAVAKKALARNAKDATMHLNYGTALAGKGDQDGATKEFDEALRLAPNNAQFFLTYSHQLAEWKKKDEAMAKLKQALRVAGDDPAILGSIGEEFRTQRSAGDCVTAFDKAIAQKDNADFRTNRALCKVAEKDKAGAMADLDAAIASDPNYSLARYWHGLLQHGDGKFTEAIADYEAYLKIAPNGPLAKAAQAKLQLAKEKRKK